MNTKEENLQKKQALFETFFNASRQEAQKKLKPFNDFSDATVQLLDRLRILGESNRKFFLNVRTDYKKDFLDKLGHKMDNKSKLAFVYEQLEYYEMKIGDAKAIKHDFHLMIYENIYNDIILPFKDRLIEIIRLENEVGSLHAKIDLSPGEYIKPPSSNQKKEIGKQNGHPGNPEEMIPLKIIDKPQQTATGKPLNNREYLSKRYKLIWTTDERMPRWIAEYLLEKKLIRDIHFQSMLDFLTTAKCNNKIAFAGNANVLSTLFYELLKTGFLITSKDFLGHILAQVFVIGKDTFRPLITKSSFSSDLRPANHSRRLKKDSPYYLDIISELKRRLLNG